MQPSLEKPSKSLNLISIRRLPGTLWNSSVWLLIITVIALSIIRTTADHDLWGNLRFGLDYVEAGGLIKPDIYSYLTAGRTFMNHMWLAEIIMAWFWLLAGPAGLVILKSVVGFLCIWLVWRQLVLAGLPKMRAAIFILLALVFFRPLLGAVRAQIFTFLLYALTLLILIKAETGKYSVLWWLVPVYIAWVNLHGGFLAGLGMVGLWAFFHVIFHKLFTNRSALVRIALPLLITILGTVINPYGLELHKMLYSTLLVPRPEVVDWQPIKVASLIGVLYLAAVALIFASILLSRVRRNPVFILLFCATAFLPLMSIRHLSLFIITAGMFTGEYIASAWERFSPYSQPSARIKPWFAVLPLAATIVSLVVYGPTLFQIHIPPNTYPVGAIRLLKDANVAGHLVVEFDWGHYTLYHLGPQVQVAIDGRREIMFSDEVYWQFLRFKYGLENWDELITQYPTDLVLMSKQSPAFGLMSTKTGWSLVYEDALSGLFAQTGSEFERQINSTLLAFPPDPVDKFFP